MFFYLLKMKGPTKSTKFLVVFISCFVLNRRYLVLEKRKLFLFYNVCYYFFFVILFYLACEQLLINRRVFACVCVCVFSKCHFIWNSFFVSLSSCFILGDVSIIHTYADLKKSVILFFGSYRVINVHKGVRTISYSPLVFFFALSLKCGILLWCYFVFFLFL